MVKFPMLIAILSCLLFVSCNYKDIPDERIFEITKNEKVFEFMAGINDEFYLKIRGNLTTGYNWFLSENSNNENLVALNLTEINSSMDYQTDENLKGYEGVGGYHYFRFKGLKKGNFNLLFIQKRVWEHSNLSEILVSITIV